MAILWDHHIIPKTLRNNKAFRGIDDNAFKFDGPENRIYLPEVKELAAKLKLSPHNGSHLDLFTEMVRRKLDKIAEIDSPDIRLGEIKTLVDAIRVGLINGDIYTNKPIDKSDDEIRELMKRIDADHKDYLRQNPRQLERIRKLEQKGADTDQDYLIKWLAFVDDPERQRVLNDAIEQNPNVKLVANHRDLDGTEWSSRFAQLDPGVEALRNPGSTPFNPDDLPPLPGYSSPSLAGLKQAEEFPRSDPRFAEGLKGLPMPSPAELRLGQLPPTPASPPDPLVLKFDPATGWPLPFSERSPILDPDPPSADTPPSALYGIAGIALLGALVPELVPFLGTLGAIGAAGTMPAGAESNVGNASIASAPGLYVPSNSGAQAGEGVAEPATRWPGGVSAQNGSSFADRFGNWTDTPLGTMPVANATEAPLVPAPGAASSEDVRNLSRVNGANASSVFTSGSAAVPYLPPTEFNDRFGNWTMPAANGRSQQVSRPTGAFADEPSYLVPPPIFGADNPGGPYGDGEEWFSRWIRPFIHPE